MVAALEHFVAAVRNRMDIHNDNSDGELAAAARELEREAQLYTAASPPEAADSREKLLSRFVVFRALKDELVRAADGRRSVLKEFWESLRRAGCAYQGIPRRVLENLRPRRRAQDAR